MKFVPQMTTKLGQKPMPVRESQDYKIMEHLEMRRAGNMDRLRVMSKAFDALLEHLEDRIELRQRSSSHNVPEEPRQDPRYENRPDPLP